MSDTPEAHEDLVESFIWQLVLDPDVYPRLTRVLGERAASALLKIASDYAATIDGTVWLSPLRLQNPGA